jgi:hypothetical protein
MSRGTGRLQNAILSHVEQAGQWCWASDITHAIYCACEPSDAQGEPPRSFHVAVRRAINSLAERGVLRTGQPDDAKIWATRYRLACWLPTHAPPPLKRTFSTTEVRQAIMDTLINADESDIEKRILWGRERHYERPSGGIPYSWLANRLREKLQPDWHYQTRLFTVMHRTLRKLVQEGVVTLHYVTKGNRVQVLFVELIADS